MKTYKFVNESGASIEVLGFTEVSSEHFREDALNFARKMHQNTARIKCNCKVSEPTSSVAKLSDTYYLKKLPNSEPHDEGCDLFKPQFGSHNPPEREKNPPKFLPFTLGRKASKEGGKSSPSGTKNSGTKPHRLYTMLAYLFAGIKKPSKDGKNYWMTLNSVHVEGDSTKKWCGKNIYRSKYLTNNIMPNWSLKKALKTPWSEFEFDLTTYVKHFEKQASRAKKNNVPPQYFEIILCDNATKNNNTLSYQQGGVYSSITTENSSKIAHRYERTSGPRLIFTENIYVDNNWVVRSLYSHPIVSNEIPILVDSNLERKFFFSIIKKMKLRAHTNTFCSYVIAKPYFAQYHNRNPNCPLIPDFKLTKKEKNKEPVSINVEVMGMINDQAYNERKDELIPLMASRTGLEVAKVEPTGNEINERHVDNIFTQTWKAYSPTK